MLASSAQAATTLFPAVHVTGDSAVYTTADVFACAPGGNQNSVSGNPPNLGL